MNNTNSGSNLSDEQTLVNLSNNSKFGHEARQLNNEEIAKLEADQNNLVPAFRRQKLEKDAKKNWDLFYKRNLDKFFRDRNWTTREFEELLQLQTATDQLEGFRYYACDFSPIALEIFKKNELYDERQCTVFEADLTKTDCWCDRLEPPDLKFHVVSMIFVLSAINPEKMSIALKNISKILHPNGILIFRDYGLYDYAMLRFAPGHKLEENFYVRQDGTRAYYFSKETMEELANDSGLEAINLEYVARETVNMKEGLTVPRIFLQGRELHGPKPMKMIDHVLGK
ncbi:Methyltransferase-like protein 6 [Blomia tropicalis]|nr:Methyltransferase-like protein 6 [Blomia tropicalis]